MLEYSLTNIAQVPSVSHRNTLVIFPIGTKKKKQKFVVGDDTGTITFFEVKRSEAIPVFTSNFDEAGLQRSGAVHCIRTNLNAKKRDRIFVAQGHRIIGMTKKGKEFFRLESPLTEAIHTMAVENVRVYTGCEYIFSLYDDGKDSGFFMSQDRINSMVLVSNSSPRAEEERKMSEEKQPPPMSSWAVLGCKDRCIRVLDSDLKLLYQVDMPSPVMCVEPYVADGAGGRGSTPLIYGTESGSVGMLSLQDQSARKLFTASDDDSSSNCRSFPTLLKPYDLTKDGVNEIIVGRTDGKLEVLSCDMEGGDMKSQFSMNLGESVQSVDCGIVTVPDIDEMIVLSYSGRVISLSKNDQDSGGAKHGSSHIFGKGTALTGNQKTEIGNLRKDLTELQDKLAKSKDKFRKMSKLYVPLSQKFEVQSRLVLDEKEAAFFLSIEIPMPLSMVTLSSTVRIDLLDTASNPAIVNRSQPDKDSKQRLLATFRYESNDTTKIMMIKLRSSEGESGDLTVGVVSVASPKICQVLRFQIKPLALHRVKEKIEPVEGEPLEEDPPWNVAKITGEFSMSMMHDWISAALLEVPPRAPEVDHQTLRFVNVFTKTQLLIEYRKNEALIKSDSASTIAIFMEVVHEKVMELRTDVYDDVTLNAKTIPHVLGLLHDKFQYQLNLAKQVEMMEAIKELSIQEQSTDWMSPQYRDTLSNADKVAQEFKDRPQALQYMIGIYKDLFVDWHKMKGDDSRQRAASLHEFLMTQYSLKGLLPFFRREEEDDGVAGGEDS